MSSNKTRKEVFMQSKRETLSKSLSPTQIAIFETAEYSVQPQFELIHVRKDHINGSADQLKWIKQVKGYKFVTMKHAFN